MEADDKKNQARARSTVYRLLKLRLRSEKEIRDKLKLKQFPDETIDHTIAYFTQIGLIDDRLFAQKWIASRLNKPFGARRIQHELKDKGIHRQIIDVEITNTSEDYCEEDVVLELARKRRRKYEGLEPQKIKQRLYGYLSRRGFSPESIFKAMKRL